MKNLELKKAFKDKYVIRVAAGIVTVAVLGTSASSGIYRVQAEKEEVTAETEAEAEDSETEEELTDALSSEEEEDTDAGKEETVYVVANADGSAKDVIVSEWLKNADGADTIEDASDLTDIENVKGDETFSQDGDSLTWQADGNDIYYQGKTDKELPVTEKVTYFLDGKEMSADEIAGKSGKLKIRFDYTNNEKVTQTIDGEKYEVYVPFTVMTGMIFTDNAKNVEVSSGKVISDGDKKIVVGMAMPGMKESLEIKDGDLEEDVDIPDYVEVSADVEDFSLDMTMSVILNDLLNDADLGGKMNLDSLEDDLDTMSDASGKLVDGSKELSDGMGTLKGSMGEFSSGVDTLKSGIASYTDGASQVDNGIRTLAGSAGTLVDGVATLNSSAATLNSGIAKLDQTLKAEMTGSEKEDLKKQADAAIEASFQDGKTGSEAIKKQAASVFYDSLANNKQAKAQVASGLGTYTETVLKSVLGQAYTTVAADTAKKDAVAEYKPQVVQAVTQQVTQAVAQQVTAGVTSQAIATQAAQAAQAAGGALDAQAVAAICTAVNDAVNTEGSEAQKQIASLMEGQTETINKLVASNVEEQMKAVEGQINTQLASKEGQAKLKETVNALVKQTVDQAMASDTLKAGINDTAAQVVSGIADGAKDTVGAAVADTAKTAAKTAAESATVTAVSSTKSQISQAINATDAASGYSLVTGMQALSEGTNTMNSSMPTLTSGISQLQAGADTLVSNNGALNDGAGKLASATTQLTDGVTKLDDGSKELKDGMVKFDKEGIQKLTEAYNGDIKGLLNRIEAVTEAGKGYQTFTKAAAGTTSSVKFIVRTEAVKAEEE